MEKVRLEGKIKGTISGKWYITRRKPEHFMVKFQAFGISEDILLDLNHRGIDFIRIIYEGKRGVKVFETTTQKFLNSLLEHTDMGIDKQKFVPVKHMDDKYE